MGWLCERHSGQAQKGTPYGVGVHVKDRHSGGGRGRKRGIARNLGVAWGRPFFMVKAPVKHTQKAPHMGWEFMWRVGIAGEDVIGSSPGKREVCCSAANKMCAPEPT